MTISKKAIVDVMTELSLVFQENDEGAILEILNILNKRKKARLPKKGVLATKGHTKESDSSKSEYRPPELFNSLDSDRSKLASFESRDALWNYLIDNAPTKSSATRLAKNLRVPVTSQNTYEDILERIIDGTIGYKLRSRAIRGDG